MSGLSPRSHRGSAYVFFWNTAASSNETTIFYFYDTPEIKRISPSYGFFQKESLITIAVVEGSNCPSLVWCRAHQSTVLGSALNSSAFTCALSFPSIGLFSVQISCNQVDFGASAADFQAIAHPSLIRCIPSSASILGGQRVTLVGQNFWNPENLTIFCRFSSTRMEPAIASSDSSVVCLVPSAFSSASHMSDISLVGFPYSWVNTIPFEYVQSNNTGILSIKPSLVSIGETTFTLSGVRFPTDAFCVFASTPSPLSHHMNHLAVCTLDIASVGRSQFDVISNNRLVASTQVSVVALPQIFACEPSQVYLGWSGSVTVSGTDFVLSDELVCSFGETLVYATYKSPQEVLCYLEVIYRDVSLRVSNDGFKFSLEVVAISVSDTEIFRIQPTLISSRYGTHVTLFGAMIPQKPFCVFE